jgi:hypothetical protein
MIILDATVVNAALPSIQNDLGFTQSNLASVVNAYPSCSPTWLPRSVFVVCVRRLLARERLVAPVDDQHRASGVRYNGLGDASDQYVGKSGASVGTEHD